MINERLKKNSFLAFIFLFFSQWSIAQLADFSLNVTAANETCNGNGSLTFQVDQTTTGSIVVFSIFQLPNLTNPIATTTDLIYEGLSTGNYRIIATQTLGNLSNFQLQDVEILNLIVPLNYQLIFQNVCGLGQITVNVTQGTAVSYEIISGPITVPQQPSNVFTNLPSGVYNIRVYNNCGDALVQTYTLQNLNTNFTINSVSLPNCKLLSCNTIGLEFKLTPTPFTAIAYPISIEYTIVAPNNTVTTYNQTVAFDTDNVIQYPIPYFNNQTYVCSIKVTDSCGNIVTSNNNQIFLKLDLVLTSSSLICAKNIKLEVCRFFEPYTVSFIAAPAGFNPVLYNSNHPGPFYDEEISYVSTTASPMPSGVYDILITDVCGRSIQKQIIINDLNSPGYLAIATNCGFGQISMPSNDGGTLVTSVIMNSAPASYNQVMPYDVSFNIVDGLFLMQNLPIGTYVFTVVDVCGNTFNYTVQIPIAPPQDVISNILKGCDIGYASLKLNAISSSFTQVIITSAPSTYTGVLDVSSNINLGVFYMNNLPEGIYSFHLEGECDLQREYTVFIPGYQVLQNNVNVEANCGSFNLNVAYQTNESYPHYFWLQKWDQSLNQWVHPLTGVPYIEGTIPITANSYGLNNFVNNLNIASIGSFRILKINSVFSNGSGNNFICISTIKEFEFSGGPKITAAYYLPCSNAASVVTIIATGTAPLHYSITTKNDQPFFVDNGFSNNFSGLESGVYNFKVQDACGNIVNRLFDLSTIPLPNISQSGLCEGQNGKLTVQNFPFLNYQWWKESDPTQILSFTNELHFIPFSTALNSGVYYVRIFSTVPGLCSEQTISYEIPATDNAVSAGQGTSSSVCGINTAIDLFSLLTGTFDANGEWIEITNSGMLSGHYWLPVGVPFGNYQFKYIVTGLCGFVSEALVVINFESSSPAPVATVNDLICNNDTLYLTASSIQNAGYEWTGPNGFYSTEQNPVITNLTLLANGIYTVKVIVNGCFSAPTSVTVVVNNSPEYSLVSGCLNDQYLITVLPTNEAFDLTKATYLWTGPNNFMSTAAQVDITNGIPGPYSVTVSFENGCSTTSNINITTTKCIIQKGISPNNDGKNDFFDLTGFDVLKFKIFNRYGLTVFEQNGYSNQWYGQDYNGRDLPDATYYYYIQFKSGEEKTGWVYVIHENK